MWLNLKGLKPLCQNDGGAFAGHSVQRGAICALPTPTVHRSACQDQTKTSTHQLACCGWGLQQSPQRRTQEERIIPVPADETKLLDFYLFCGTVCHGLSFFFFLVHFHRTKLQLKCKSTVSNLMWEEFVAFSQQCQSFKGGTTFQTVASPPQVGMPHRFSLRSGAWCSENVLNVVLVCSWWKPSFKSKTVQSWITFGFCSCLLGDGYVLLLVNRFALE